MKKFREIVGETIWLAICAVFCLLVLAVSVAILAVIIGSGAALDGTNPRYEG